MSEKWGNNSENQTQVLPPDQINHVAKLTPDLNMTYEISIAKIREKADHDPTSHPVILHHVKVSPRERQEGKGRII